MVDARVTFLNMRVCAVRDTVTRHPVLQSSPVVSTTKLVVFPMADRVAHVGRIERILVISAHIGRRRRPISPDFAPNVHVLKQNHRPVGHRRNGERTPLVVDVLGKSDGIANGGRRIVGARRAVLSDGFL